MTRYPTCDDVLAFLQEQGQPAMASVVETLRDSERSCRQAAEKNLAAYYELKLKHEPPPACPPSHRSYLAKPESSD